MSSNNEAKTLTETAREWTEELRRREAERYETLLRERLKERYPNPSPEQKRKIEARVQTLMERHGATLGARAATAMPPLRRFEQQLQQPLAGRGSERFPQHNRRLPERHALPVERHSGRR